MVHSLSSFAKETCITADRQKARVRCAFHMLTFAGVNILARDLESFDESIRPNILGQYEES
jgi:hypothetical protein